MISINQLVESQEPRNGRFYTVAIDGRGCSGKSTLLKYLASRNRDGTYLYGDDYFEPINDPIAWGAFNEERFQHEVIQPLKSGVSFRHKPYDYASNKVLDRGIVEINHVFCLERVYSFIAGLGWDLKIWVEVPAELCFERGLQRDRMPKYKAEMAWQKWQAEEESYIKQNSPHAAADIVLDGRVDFKNQID